MDRLKLLKAQKALYGLTHPWCWRALARGVAPAINQAEVLRSTGHDLLLDVGAHKGQFTLMGRRANPAVRVHAYEPQSAQARIFHSLHGRDPMVTLHQTALGDAAGSSELHISRRTDSSSFLPASNLLTELFEDTQHEGSERVSVARLDDFPEHWGDARKALLKIDVQGFELNVLRGAEEALRHCGHVYAECSHVVLYEGQALFEEIEAFLAARGFRQQVRRNEDLNDGAIIQADYLFSRVPPGASPP
jgi:FkbM family methyltransferase